MALLPYKSYTCLFIVHFPIHHYSLGFPPKSFKKLLWNAHRRSAYSQVHFTTRGYAKSGMQTGWIKAVANEDTFLPIQNVSPFARARTNFVSGTQKTTVSGFVQKHFVSATTVSQFAQPKKHHGQQCVRNNVSSLTRAFMGNWKTENCQSLWLSQHTHVWLSTDLNSSVLLSL